MALRSFVRLTLDGLNLALPLAAVERVVRSVAVTPLPGAPACIAGAIDFHGTVVAVADLRERFGLPPAPVRMTDHFVFARTPSRLLALVADAAQGVVEVEDSDRVDAGAVAGGLERISGIARTADGLLLIQDLERLLSSGEEALLQQALAHA
jgi:purine-binding chemotaxis protein CheW